MAQSHRIDINSIKLGQILRLINKIVDDDHIHSNGYGKNEKIKAILNSGFNIDYATTHVTWYSNEFKIKKKLEYHQGSTKALKIETTEYCKGTTALHFAVKQKLNKTIELLLSYHANVTCKNDDGDTPLRLAMDNIKDMYKREFRYKTIKNTYSPIVEKPIENQIILSHIESKNTTNPSCKDGISHFHIACLIDNEQVVDFFLESGVAVNETVSSTSYFYPGYSSLHFAVQYSSVILVQKLLFHGANVNLMNANNMTPLSLIVKKTMKLNCDNGNKEDKIERNNSIIKLLINENNASNLINHVDENGFSFFHASCTLKDTFLAEKFLEIGVDINSCVNFESKIFPGYTPLHFAAHNNLEMIMLLLENGANILAKDSNGLTPFDYFNLNEVYEVLNIDPVLQSINFQNGTKLIDAVTAMQSNTSFEDFISNVGVNMYLPSDSLVWPGYTLMHIILANTKNNNSGTFSSFTKFSVFKILLKHNVDVSIKDAHGRNPLHLAFLRKKERYVDEIFSFYKKKSIESFSKEDNALNLQIACITNSTVDFEKLLLYGADPNVKIDNVEAYKHCTSLHHIVVENESEKMIKILYKMGFTLDLFDSDNLICICIGILNGSSVEWIHSALTKYLSNPNVSKILHTNKYNLSLLHVACWIGNLDAVKTVLQITKSNINEQIVCDSSDRYSEKFAPYLGFTPLHFAIEKLFCEENGSFDKIFKIIKVLITNEADVHVKNCKGLNPLHLTLFLLASNKSFKFDVLIYSKLTLKMLIQEFDKNNTWQSDFGLTRLHMACYMNDLTVINDLLQSETEINKQIDLKSPFWPGDTPLHILLNNSNFEKSTVKLLIDHGADVTIENLKGQTPFHILLHKNVLEEDDYSSILKQKNICKINLCDENGINYFHLFCLQSYSNVEQLLKLGVDINQSVNFFSTKYPGYTPLHFAVENQNEDEIQLLVKYGADFTIEDSFCRTPLHIAAEIDPELFKYFLRDDKKIIQCKNGFGRTALDVLIKYYFEKVKYNYQKYLGCCKILLNHDIYINFFNPLKDSLNDSAALVASSFDSNTFELLIEKSTNLMNVDSSGQNLIRKIFYGSYKYCYENELRVMKNVELLINKIGIDIDLKDKHGKTALHKALFINRFNSVKLLLNLGADINILDDQGKNLWEHDRSVYDFNYNYNYDENYVENISDTDEDSDSARFLLLKFHIIKLHYLDFYLHPSIKNIVESNVSCNPDYYLKAIKKYELELKLMENEKLIDSLSLRDVLKKDFIEKFFCSSMTIDDRQIIFEKLYSDHLFLDYNELCPLLKIQLRKIEKIKKHKELLGLATDSLWNISHLPIICIELIFKYLSNEDIKNLSSV